MNTPPASPDPFADIKVEHRLRRELFVLVILKLILLLVIKQLWFSEPVARHMQVPPDTVAEHIFGNVNPSKPPQSPAFRSSR